MTMRVLIVNTSESKGGAAVAAKRLTQALINHGVKAKMMVCEKQTDAVYVAQYGRPWRHRLAFLGERIGIWMNNLFSRKHLFEVSTADWGVDITHTEEFREADIIHLHWVNQGMLSLAGVRKILRSGKPVVWTMHDMWPCTAICHHAHQCNRFQESCGQCLFLRFPREHDLSYRVFRQKNRVLQEGSLHMVAVSSWLAERAATSALLKGREITVIPNSLSLERFRLLNRTDMRSLLHLSSKYIIAFGAARIDTPIKGFTYLKQALAYMVETSNNVASVATSENEINIVTSQRSNVMSNLENETNTVKAAFELAGAEVKMSDGYPAWKMNPDSKLTKVAVESYKKLFGKEPIVKGIHAGLECGLFSERYPNLDMVSFGPTLRDVHTPDERLYIPTVQMVWDHLLDILKNV